MPHKGDTKAAAQNPTPDEPEILNKSGAEGKHEVR
jgi:hypothetical protein